MKHSVKILDANGQPMVSAGAGTLTKTGTDRALKDWHPGSKSTDARHLPGMQRNVARTRDLVSGNGFAAAGPRRNNINIVGSGLRLDYEPKWKALGIDPDSEEARDFIEAVETEYDLWSRDIKTGADLTGRTHLGGLARQAFTHYLEDGEICTNVLWSRQSGRRYQTQLQNIDPDRLSNPMGGVFGRAHQSGNVIKAGVEQTMAGAPVAYHVREQHCSEAGYMGVNGTRWKRIPAFVRGTNRRNFIHYFNIERSGQSRGRSPLTTVLEKFKKLDLFQDSTLQAAIISAMFSFVIESPFDESLLGDQLSRDPVNSGSKIQLYQDVREKFHEKSDITLGGVKPLMTVPGEVIKPLMANRPSPEYAGFVQSFMEEMAAANGMSLEQYTGNWTQTNYSSARAALNEAWKIMKVERDEFALHWYGAIFELWLEEALDKGYIALPAGAPGFYEMRQAWLHAKWIGPGRGYVDPVKEAQAAGMRIQLGVSNVKMEAAEQGLDYHNNVRQLGRERAEFQREGLTHPVDRTVTAKSALTSAQVPDTDGRQPVPDDEDTDDA